jgi:polyhydroxyalkanoate synthase subunit PhaC
VNPVAQLARLPRAAVEFSNVLLTQGDADIGMSPKDVIWTHRATTLYRYRSSNRRHPVPVLLVFALINRPDIFDLTPGRSFVEFLLGEGFDVFLLDWGEPDDEDADMGLSEYVVDELPWAMRETLRESDAEELSLLGWCIGGTVAAMTASLSPEGDRIRNLALLTTPVDTTEGLYTRWIARDSFDPEVITDTYPSVPGPAIDFANKLMKPVTSYWTIYRTLFEDVLAGKERRASYQPMAKWVSDNPPFPGRAYREWIQWMYKENRLVRGRMRMRGRRVDLGAVDQSVLVVTAGDDHIAPPPGTEPIFDLVASDDVTHLDRPGGHIGLMAGSSARDEIWPDIASWLEARSK